MKTINKPLFACKNTFVGNSCCTNQFQITGGDADTWTQGNITAPEHTHAEHNWWVSCMVMPESESYTIMPELC